jgi:hypothetical protein
MMPTPHATPQLAHKYNVGFPLPVRTAQTASKDNRRAKIETPTRRFFIVHPDFGVE